MERNNQQYAETFERIEALKALETGKTDMGRTSFVYNV